MLSVAQEIILYCIYTDTAQTPSCDNYSPPTTNGANSRKMSADFILVHVNSDLEKKEAILMLLIEGLISQLVDCLPSSLDVEK